MEQTQVSEHAVRVFAFVAAADGWLTNHEIAKGAHVAERTARLHSKAFTDLGIFEAAPVFPGYRYRLSPQAEKRNKAYVRRLIDAEKILKGGR